MAEGKRGKRPPSMPLPIQKRDGVIYFSLDFIRSVLGLPSTNMLARAFRKGWGEQSVARISGSLYVRAPDAKEFLSALAELYRWRRLEIWDSLLDLAMKQIEAKTTDVESIQSILHIFERMAKEK